MLRMIEEKTGGRAIVCSAQRTLFAFRQLAQVFGAIFKFREMVEKNEFDFSDGAVPLFSHKQFRHATQIFAVALVHLFSKNKRDEIGILLDRPRFTQIAQLRAVISLAGFGSAAQLREN